MHDEPTHGLARERDSVQLILLDLLLSDESPGLWSHDEIARAMGDPVVAIDATDTLHAAGLLHRIGDFVFPTRAAARSPSANVRRRRWSPTTAPAVTSTSCSMRSVLRQRVDHLELIASERTIPIRGSGGMKAHRPLLRLGPGFETNSGPNWPERPAARCRKPASHSQKRSAGGGTRTPDTRIMIPLL
jgi:hypothetical protein